LSSKLARTTYCSHGIEDEVVQRVHCSDHSRPVEVEREIVGQRLVDGWEEGWRGYVGADHGLTRPEEDGHADDVNEYVDVVVVVGPVERELSAGLASRLV
jgi:hypothetical protein